jgi:hypothetical protein
MADPNESKKETVRIAMPPPPTTLSGTGNESRDTARINLSAGPPATVPTRRATHRMAPSPEPARVVKPPQFFPASPPAPATAPSPVPANVSAASSTGPKKETARIAMLPNSDPKASPTMEIKETQPLITLPEIARQNAPITVARRDASAIVDAMPKLLCWALLGVSAVILIIQIWNYLS